MFRLMHITLTILVSALAFLIGSLNAEKIIAKDDGKGKVLQQEEDEATNVCRPLRAGVEAKYPCELDDVGIVESQLREALDKANRRSNSGGGGFFSPEVHVFCDPKKGRGLKAVEKGFKKSDIIIRLPLGALLTSKSFSKADDIRPVNHLDALALALIEEKRKGLDDYVDTLPLQTGVMTAFRLCDQDLLDKVKDEDTREQAREMKEAIDDRAEELIELGFITKSSEYVNALSVVQSRVFVLSVLKDGNWVKVPSLVMIADMLNLSLDPNTDCITNDKSTHFECYATRDIEKGEELTAPFVKQSEAMDMNSFTWFYYGFEFSAEELVKQATKN